ncbi:MAG: type II toxin-antitoxin system RelE/ParE family toxin [Ignavibacteriales bacterium]|nr:type II toxin-antitoxin system RelE/ParE family toxin [Ignavibacteriales bacterium]
MGQVRWTKKSASHLEEIHSFIAKGSPLYATRFMKSLIQATLKLETLPLCGRIVPELEEFGFREVFYRNYRIIYRIVSSSNDVEILSIIHSARIEIFKKQEEWIL